MKSAILVLLLFTISFTKCYAQWESNIPSNAQWESQKQVTAFKTRSSSPIQIEVLKKDGQYAFIATNRSLYPYALNLKISKIVNLDPASFERTFILQPGKNNLVTLRRREKSNSSNYSYTYTYSIGDPFNTPDENFTYLLPVRDGNSIDLYYKTANKKIYMRNFFKMQKGDTVYCMRKGYVTAIPGMYHSSDRIANSNSLEVRHPDGTVLIYENINEEKVFTDASKKVYPGQPLGIIGNQEHLKVQLYNIASKNKLKRMTIKYYIENENQEFSYNFRNLKAKHPEEIVQKEMRKREIKKYKKGKLFNKSIK